MRPELSCLQFFLLPQAEEKIKLAASQEGLGKCLLICLLANFRILLGNLQKSLLKCLLIIEQKIGLNG